MSRFSSLRSSFQITGCTANAQRCIFPFKYKGKTYNSCIKVDSVNEVAWCALALNGNGEVIFEERADCDPNCFVGLNGK